ncbi:CGNR zinc finger domain-containing protein [Streptomyces meridianus]|uniref:CGNR zinc finger domain-containing protein n=1 Tax=Streptomyces meridianus TaxID=2938945 RepID=A0ABT0X236_9ACTN|nr:CGNR zinc finger domain-containing protein [Streptomyces meridianus]MCM2576593.1 CGNR zinc finger domain-containing protein [Streptomyces meridianus]
MDRDLALELVGTIRHDGAGGVADDWGDLLRTSAWIRDRAELLAVGVEADGFAADEALRRELVALRQAVRALFAQAVRPSPPSPADAGRLMPADRALAALNAAARREPVIPQLEWADGEPPSVRLLSDGPDFRMRLVAALARAAIDFLAGPELDRLRACTAPRCVRYFVRSHGRQEWCKPSCGNRARVARHYRRRSTTAADAEPSQE